MPKDVVIIGAGGVGREIYALIHKYFADVYKVVGFIDDIIKPGSFVNGIEILGGIDWYKYSGITNSVIMALGNPEFRKKAFLKLGDNYDYPTIIHPDVKIHDEVRVKVGKGCFISDNCVLTTDIIVSDFCFINTSCSLHHDTHLEKNCVIMPGVRITGGAKIGENSYISPNVVIASKVNIKANSIVKESIL
ncbi:hypothetical protein [Flavobacterium beibuense]|uniref:Sugar O-acyltransferase, sialic acid O-acetyltransferase NeuD family n=1 Tax=Flavobacterium beibuense TaxID=657326 RepID=A0A444WIE5_9FLAO|nr:hypothetical protein [Flavobacterium beibuense]RYJ45597.1 Sugar O-acyltransferase, sialic acid O-acetyltransferase NeuD family [Flavobacterium beibuense]